MTSILAQGQPLMALERIKMYVWLIFRDKNGHIRCKMNLSKRSSKMLSFKCQRISTNYKLRAVSKSLR